MDYNAIGLTAGIEIHQQLEYRRETLLPLSDHPP